MSALLSLADVRRELGGISRSKLRRLIVAGKLAPGRVWIPGGRPHWRAVDVAQAVEGMQEAAPKRRSA